MKKHSGLSLVELMISLALGLVLMAGVVQIFLSSKTVFVAQQGLSRIQETGRLAVEFIGRDLRMASYYGCVNTIDQADKTSNITNTLTGLTGLHTTFEQGLIGYTDSTLPHGVATDLGGGFVIKSPSDLIVIRGSNERGVPIPKTSPTTQTTAIGYTPETALNSAGCVEGFCSGGIAVVTNCQQGRFFKISGSPTLGSNSVTLTHADSWPISATPPQLPDIYASGNIFPVHTIVYFVGTSNTPLNNTIPSLWQKIDTQAPLEILQGVENISIRYSSGGAYQPASSVTDWNLITTVRIEVLVRGLEQKNLDDVQPYTFAGATTTPTDKIIRQVFKATFSVRSRAN